MLVEPQAPYAYRGHTGLVDDNFTGNKKTIKRNAARSPKQSAGRRRSSLHTADGRMHDEPGHFISQYEPEHVDRPCAQWPEWLADIGGDGRAGTIDCIEVPASPVGS